LRFRWVKSESAFVMSHIHKLSHSSALRAACRVLRPCKAAPRFLRWL